MPTGRFDVILTAINYSMADDKALLEAMSKAAKAGIGLVAMKTQCRQAWSKESGAAGPEYHEGSIWHAALLKWALRLESVTTAIPGYTTFQQLETDWPVASNLEFTPTESQVPRRSGGASWPWAMSAASAAAAPAPARRGSMCRHWCAPTCMPPTTAIFRRCAGPWTKFLPAGACRPAPAAGNARRPACAAYRIARRLGELKAIFA